MIDPTLVDLCRRLNAHGIEYAVAGAHACALHGHVRATEDFDILVRNTKENLDHVIVFLRDLFPHLTEKPTPKDIVDNIVLKIIDEIELDIMIQVWRVDFESVRDRLKFTTVDSVRIPYLGLDALIESKSTAREIDQWDVKILREISRRHKG